MPKLSFWQQLTGSVLNFDYYPIFVERSVGKAISYLILLTFIITMIVGIQVAMHWNSSVEMARRALVDAPDFVFSNGELTVNAPMPYIISSKDNELYIIDTSGQSNEAVLQDYVKGTFIGKDKIAIKKSPLNTESYSLRALDEFTFTKVDVVESMPLLIWLNIIIVLLMFVFSGIANLAAALFVSLCGIFASRIMNFAIGFNDLYKISIYVLTLPLLFELLCDFSNVLYKVAFYLIAIIYIVKVLQYLKARRREDASEI